MKRSLFETKSDTTTKPSEKKSKYSFWARHPLPDPRWSSEQQLAIGPIQCSGESSILMLGLPSVRKVESLTSSSKTQKSFLSKICGQKRS